MIRPARLPIIVVFDPITFRDAATFDQPTTYAPGVHYLFVNGAALIDEGKLTVAANPESKLPGRALRLAHDGPGRIDRQGEADLDRRSQQSLGRGAGDAGRCDRRGWDDRRTSCDFEDRRPA